MLSRMLAISLLLVGCAEAQEGVSTPAGESSSTPTASITVEIAHAVPAEYPASAVANRIEGAVSVSVVIAPSGAVVSAQADDANPLLQIAAVEASKKYTFKARKGDEYVEVKCWAELMFDFKLPNPPGTMPSALLISANLIHSDAFPESMRVSEALMRARVLRSVEPIYPRETMKSKAQGKVVLDLSVGQDGKVHDVRVLSGPPELADPLAKSIRQWEFEPYKFLGENINVETRFNRSIKLSVGPMVYGTLDDAKALLWLNNPQGIKRGVCLTTVKGSYPKKAKEKGVQGPVLVAVVIGQDGTVRSAKAIRGDDSLWKPAIDAAKQWRYAPSTLKDRPVEVHDIITVEFE